MTIVKSLLLASQRQSGPLKYCAVQMLPVLVERLGQPDTTIPKIDSSLDTVHALTAFPDASACVSNYLILYASASVC